MVDCLTNPNEGNDVVRKIEGGKEKHSAPFFFFIAVLKQHGKLFLVVHVSTQGVKKICLGKSKNANKQSWKHKVEANLEARWSNTSSML